MIEIARERLKSSEQIQPLRLSFGSIPKSVLSDPSFQTESAKKACNLYENYPSLKQYFEFLERQRNYDVGFVADQLGHGIMTFVLKKDGRFGLMHLDGAKSPFSISCQLPEAHSGNGIDINFFDVHYAKHAVLDPILAIMDIPSKGFIEDSVIQKSSRVTTMFKRFFSPYDHHNRNTFWKK